jgi:fructose-1-phosphate kinase PfkB-like protein
MRVLDGVVTCGAAWAGRDTERDEDVVASAQVMLEQGVDDVLVKRGTSGSMLVSSSGETLMQPIFPVEKVVPWTGPSFP